MRAPRRTRSWAAPSKCAMPLLPFSRPPYISRTRRRGQFSRKCYRFHKPLLDFTLASNRHHESLTRPGTPSCVWETQAKKAVNVRTVLDPIIHDGHENVIDFIGAAAKVRTAFSPCLSWFVLKRHCCSTHHYGGWRTPHRPPNHPRRRGTYSPSSSTSCLLTSSGL